MESPASLIFFEIDSPTVVRYKHDSFLWAALHPQVTYKPSHSQQHRQVDGIFIARVFKILNHFAISSSDSAPHSIGEGKDAPSITVDLPKDLGSPSRAKLNASDKNPLRRINELQVGLIVFPVRKARAAQRYNLENSAGTRFFDTYDI
jgi:hypothetical protein